MSSLTNNQGLTVSIHQPAYLPYGGFFAKVLSSDLLIVLDTVLFSRQGYQNRNRIRTQQGLRWLTIPVHGRHVPKLCDLQVDNQSDWAFKHWRTVQNVYGYLKAQDLSWLRNISCELFVDVACESLLKLLMLFGNPIPFIRASKIMSTEPPDMGADDRLIALMQKVGGSVYTAGPLGCNYMNKKKWEAAGIQVAFCHWKSPVYPQHHHSNFISNLSIIDLIGQLGIERTKELIYEGRIFKGWSDMNQSQNSAHS